MSSKSWDAVDFEDHLEDEKHISPKVRRRVLQRDNYRCRRCGVEDNLNLHHVVFRWKREGTHNPDNLITLCWYHHRMIHDRRLDVIRIAGIWYFKEL